MIGVWVLILVGVVVAGALAGWVKNMLEQERWRQDTLAATADAQVYRGQARALPGVAEPTVTREELDAYISRPDPAR